MKKEKKALKLALSKETLQALDSRQVEAVQGGISAEYCSRTCLSYCELCTN